jgi:hypothetical protein
LVGNFMHHLKSFFLLAVFSVFSSCGVFAQSITELEFETSSDLNVWETLSLRDLLQTGDGKLQHSSDEGNLWYRLKINRGNQAQIDSKVTLADVPESAVRIAKGFLADFSDNELGEGSGAGDGGGWGADSVLADYAYPLYNPGIRGGNEPAFYEFVIGVPPEPKFTPGPLTPNKPVDAALIDVGGHLLVQNTGIVKKGSILVSVTDQVEPIPSFSTEGDAEVAKLLARAGTPNVKAVWYDAGFLAGEDASGKLIATLGNAPFKVDSTPILEMIDRGIDGYEYIATNEGSTGPDIQGKAPEFFRSYDEFKNYYLTDPLMVKLREQRAKAAILDWDIANDRQPNLVNVTIGEQSLIQKGQSITSFDINVDNFEDEVPGNIGVVIPDTGGIILVGREAGPVILTLTYENGTSAVVLVKVSVVNPGGGIVDPGGGIVDPGGGIVDPGGGIVPRGGVAKGWGSWTSWTSWYAGNWGDQRQYWQFWNDPEMCPDDPSGCGPTAWAIAYGWWDLKGVPRAMGNTSLADAPHQNDNDVRACCRYVFDRIDTWCVWGADAAATNPWDMHDGYRWASHRGLGFSCSSTWGVPYASSSYKKSRDAIKSGYPAIIGVGFYVHYAFAYGYRYRKYRWAGVTWNTQRRFKCNNGQGSSSHKWYSNSSVWFGQRLRLW